jgi:glyoxylase-like metal-dependent hydrolase (beta-lactamase superfamily II)
MSPASSSHRASFTRRDALRAIALTLGATALPSSLGIFSSAARAATPTPTPSATPAPVVANSLGGKFSWISGLGGNVAVLGGDDGVLAIDTGLATVTEKTVTEIAKSGPIKHVVNTHWHYDHVGGNETLAKAGAHIAAHANCRTRVSTEQYNEPFNRKLAALPPAAWPRTTFTSETTLHLNGEEVRLIPVPPAHTDGDVIVRFEKADVIHAGDLYFNGAYPFIDYSSAGWLGGLVGAIRRIAELATPKTRIIPGHGPLATTDDLRGYLAFLETMLERFTKLKNEGKTVDEAVAAAPAKEFDEKLGKGFMKPEPFVRITYTGLLRHQ